MIKASWFPHNTHDLNLVHCIGLMDVFPVQWDFIVPWSWHWCIQPHQSSQNVDQQVMMGWWLDKMISMVFPALVILWSFCTDSVLWLPYKSVLLWVPDTRPSTTKPLILPLALGKGTGYKPRRGHLEMVYTPILSTGEIFFTKLWVQVMWAPYP